MVDGATKAHGGTLEIRSTPGAGTEVRFRFPVDAPAVVAKQETPATAARSLPANLLRILLVDDDDLIRMGVCALLESYGHEVREAERGADALAILDSGYDPHVIILDVNMPGLSGPETLDRLLATRPHQPVLMASGYGDEEMAKAMTDRPNVSAIQKPFTIDELLTRVQAMGLS